jgi:hypothetical protein
MQTKVRVTYGGYIGAWCSFLFMIHFMNPAPRRVSPVVFAGFAVAAVYAVAVGLVMRKKFFAKSAEALRSDPRKAFNQWEAANMNPTIFGVALKFIGASWLVPGILFAIGLGFLVLWRPRSNLGFPTTDGTA